MNKSFGYYCLRYVGFSLLITALIVAIVYGIYAAAPVFAAWVFEGRAGLGVVSVIVPAMMAAQVFYRLEQRKMTSGESWSMAVAFMLLAFAVNGLLVWASLKIVPLSYGETNELVQLWQNGRDILMIIAAVFALVLLNKLMFWSGIRGEIKTAERKAAKAARKG
jgi:hypothetical protein